MSEVVDLYLRKQLWLDRHANGRVRDRMEQVRGMRDEAHRRLNVIARTAGERGAYQRYIDTLEGVLRRGYDTMAGSMEHDLIDLAEVEHEFHRDVITNAWPRGTGAVNFPDLDDPVLAIGRAKESFDKLKGKDSLFVRGTVAEAVATGTTTRDAINMIQAGISKKLNLSRAQVATIVRSGIMSTAAGINGEYIQANVEAVDTVAWLSTLDGRTTIFCAARDGLQYTALDKLPVDHDMPWDAGPGNSHYNCRSVEVPAFGEPLTGFRAGKDYTQKDRHGRPGKGRQFRASTNFDNWFARQPASFKKEYLGPKRYALYKEGLSLREFARDATGEMFTLDQLKSRYSDLFESIGA